MSPTLNVFDNSGDARAVVLVYENHAQDCRVREIGVGVLRDDRVEQRELSRNIRKQSNRALEKEVTWTIRWAARPR